MYSSLAVSSLSTMQNRRRGVRGTIRCHSPATYGGCLRLLGQNLPARSKTSMRAVLSRSSHKQSDHILWIVPIRGNSSMAQPASASQSFERDLNMSEGHKSWIDEGGFVEVE